MKTFSHRVAAITGASSGIGRMLAIELARQGATLALSDVLEDALQETAELCQAQGATVTQHIVDVCDARAVTAWADDVVAQLGQVHMLFNNAGIAIHGSFEEVPPDIFERVIDINFWGVVHGTRAFLPHLREAEDAHIINVSSIFGIIAAPGQSAYNASKFAVRGFTECLRQELELTTPHIHITCVHPGGIKTNIARASIFVGESFGTSSPEKFSETFDKLARTSPEIAAATILDGVLGNEPRVLIGPDARALDLLQRVSPARYPQLIKTVFSKRFMRKKR